MECSLEVDVKNKLLLLSVALGLMMISPPLPASPKASKKAVKQYQKPVKMLIGAIRYKKDGLALKMLALDEMTHQLCIHHWGKMNADQRKEFSQNLGVLLRKISFPKARDLFKHIDAILYDPPKVKGKQVDLRTTIVVHRSYKKKELVLTWTLFKGKKGWMILDVTTAKQSTIEGLREEQIDPLVKDGGVALLLKKMREKMAEKN